MATDAATTLASAPIGQILRDLAIAIADAQQALDNAAIDSAKALAKGTVTIPDNRDGAGDEATRTESLLGMGFAPTFYSFVEADVEVVLETRIEGETSVGVGGQLDVTAPVKSVAVGMTMSVDVQRKFAVETSGHTRITAKLVSLPPPTRFLDVLSGEA